MSRLPTGMYQPGTSSVHRMDPCIKIIGLIILLAAAVATDSFVGYGVWVLFLLLLMRAVKLPAGTVFASVWRLRWFFIIILIMNTCFYGPEKPWVSFWIFKPSYEGLMQGVNVVARVVIMLAISNVLTVSTAPLAMTGAMEKLMSPLRVIKLPTDQIAMILSVAIQFIPTLFEETDMIRKAQTARGARFDSRRLMDKAKAVIPLVVPIFLAAFKRADELSLAMEARGYTSQTRYGGRSRTVLHGADWAALALCAVMCAVQIVIL